MAPALADLLWQATPAQQSGCRMAAFHRFAAQHFGAPPYQLDGAAAARALHAWSIAERAAFWLAVWQFCGVIGNPGERVLVDDAMPGARWFPDARLNFARNLLRRRDEGEALVFYGEDRVCLRYTHAQLYRAVAQCAQALRAAGVGPGDRVAAWAPNTPHCVILMLATTALGAVFSSTAPEFGVPSVLERFGQISPKLLLAADAYCYNGRVLDCRPRLAAILAGLPSLQQVLLLPYREQLQAAAVDPVPGLDEVQSWDAFLAPHQDAEEIPFVELAFDQPLYILFSSGTTGLPKCIVHGAGGTLLQHLKEHQLHGDLQRDERLFYYTTCAWMMWNWLVSGLASGATLLLYDGAPFAADGALLWQIAENERCTHFGCSAKYLDALAKSGREPCRQHRLEALRVMFSTGSPLAPEGFDYVYRAIKPSLLLASISGGTDIVSCFVLGNPLRPLYRGQIQGPGLGMAVEVWDEQGRRVRGEKGELVCTRTFPSMPLGFWQDPLGERYRATYFSCYPGVWCHGDWCEETAAGGYIIHGRADATLNPGGVRIGSAEIYRVVEQLPAVIECIAVGQRWPPATLHERIVLFVRLREGCVLDAALQAQIRQRLREAASPRHVPACIVQVAEIPRTRNGKLVELAVRQMIHGEAVLNLDALANPAALEAFRQWAQGAGASSCAD